MVSLGNFTCYNSLPTESKDCKYYYPLLEGFHMVGNINLLAGYKQCFNTKCTPDSFYLCMPNNLSDSDARHYNMDYKHI